MTDTTTAREATLFQDQVVSALPGYLTNEGYTVDELDEVSKLVVEFCFIAIADGIASAAERDNAVGGVSDETNVALLGVYDWLVGIPEGLQEEYKRLRQDAADRALLQKLIAAAGGPQAQADDSYPGYL